GVTHAVKIVAIDTHARNAVAESPIGNASGNVAGGRLRDRPAVVLANVDNWQMPARCQVQSLVDVAAIGSPISEGTHAHPVAAFLLESQRGARRGTDGGPQVTGDPGHDIQLDRTVERN